MPPGNLCGLFALAFCVEFGLPLGGLCGLFATLLGLALDLPLGGVRRLPPAHLDQGGELPGLGITHAGLGRLPTRVFIPAVGATQYDRDGGGNGQPPRRRGPVRGNPPGIRLARRLGHLQRTPHLDLGLRRLSEQHRPQLRDGLRALRVLDLETGVDCRQETRPIGPLCGLHGGRHVVHVHP